MKITVQNEKEGSTKTITTSAKTIQELLFELGVNSETVLVARNSDILIPSDTLENGDSIILLSVISGG